MLYDFFVAKFVSFELAVVSVVVWLPADNACRCGGGGANKFPLCRLRALNLNVKDTAVVIRQLKQQQQQQQQQQPSW